MQKKPILIIDGHLDMAFCALHHRRDLTQPVAVLRDREGGRKDAASSHPDSLERRKNLGKTYPGTATVSLPALRRGHVGIVLTSIMCRVDEPGPHSHNAARTQTAAHAKGKAHLAYYRALEGAGEINLLKTPADLDSSVSLWEDAAAKKTTAADSLPIGVILSMESADPILDPDQVRDWWTWGLRSVSLTHFGVNTWGHGTGTEGGLFPPAFPLMDAMRETGIAIDVSHLADLAFWQVMEYWNGPVHASHCACRALVPGQRHLSDEMIRALIQRDGVIGGVFFEGMLNPEWNFNDPATRKPHATRSMSAVVEHIDHICQIAGNADHVAIGSDLDGGYGRELAPTDIDTIADLQNFPLVLQHWGFSEANILKVAHGNLLRLFRRAWKDSK